MALSPTSELRFRTRDGAPCACREWTPLLLELPCAPEDWQEIVVTVNGAGRPVQLRRFGQSVHIVCEWPECGAGNYVVTIDCSRTYRETHRLFVPPAKLSADGLQLLMEDLDHRLPHALAATLQRGGALAGLCIRPPEAINRAAELIRLRRIVEGGPRGVGLAALLRMIARDPHRLLRETTLVVPTERARLTSPTLLLQALYRAYSVDDDGLPLRIADRRVEPTHDVPENRLLRHVHDLVARRLRRLRLLLPETARGEVDSVAESLADARRAATFLNEVAPLAHPPTQPSMVLLRRPEYRRVLELWRELALALEVRLEAEALDTPLGSVPALYELWGALAVTVAVSDIAITRGFRVTHQRLVRPVAGTMLVEFVPDGECVLDLAHADGRRLRLVPQRSFGVAGPFRSVSYTQRPDLALEFTRTGAPPALLLLDPKYKVDDVNGIRPKKDDIDKMHAYRDAIVREDGERAVVHAAILYPGPPVRFGESVSAIRADPEASEQLAGTIERLLCEHAFGEPTQPADSYIPG